MRFPGVMKGGLFAGARAALDADAFQFALRTVASGTVLLLVPSVASSLCRCSRSAFLVGRHIVCASSAGVRMKQTKTGPRSTFRSINAAYTNLLQTVDLSSMCLMGSRDSIDVKTNVSGTKPTVFLR